RKALLIGAGISLAVHLLSMLVAALWMVRLGDAGGAEEQGGQVEFAIMSEAEFAAIEALAADRPEISVDAELERVQLDADPSSAAEALDSLSELSGDLAIEAGAGDLSDTGEGFDGGAGAIGGASFFGLEATGRRFAYIVDKSRSMQFEGKIERVTAELIRSLRALPPNAQFVVLYYSNDAVALLRGATWTDATERQKRRAREAALAIVPDGATRPLPAFDRVFDLAALPDAIYFMTDGVFTDDSRYRGDVVEVLARMNRGARIPIHTIMFGDVSDSREARDRVESDMRQIARQSGGRFTKIGGRSR
ncbi:MAG: hypothetical protein AAFP22_23285, partial [Planctomycetota bacterium]